MARCKKMLALLALALLFLLCFIKEAWQDKKQAPFGVGAPEGLFFFGFVAKAIIIMSFFVTDCKQKKALPKQDFRLHMSKDYITRPAR